MFIMRCETVTAPWFSMEQNGMGDHQGVKVNKYFLILTLRHIVSIVLSVYLYLFRVGDFSS